MFTVLSWITLGWIVLTTLGVSWWLFLAGWRPWMLRETVPAPRELPALEWVVPDQDNPIPWI